MLERWLAGATRPHGGGVTGAVAAALQVTGQRAGQRLQALWPGTLALDYQPQERYVFRLADQVLEFDTEATCQRLEPKLLSCLASLPESVRTLDQVSMQRLSDLCSSFGEVRHEDLKAWRARTNLRTHQRSSLWSLACCRPVRSCPTASVRILSSIGSTNNCCPWRGGAKRTSTHLSARSAVRMALPGVSDRQGVDGRDPSGIGSHEGREAGGLTTF